MGPAPFSTVMLLQTTGVLLLPPPACQMPYSSVSLLRPAKQGSEAGLRPFMHRDSNWLSAARADRKLGLPPALTIDDGINSLIPPGMIRGVSPIASAMSLIDEIKQQMISPPIRELYDLLRKNPGVRIYSTPNRFALLRNGKHVGGRINELVFRTPDVTNYILNHPAEEIDGGNFIITRHRNGDN